MSNLHAEQSSRNNLALCGEMDLARQKAYEAKFMPLIMMYPQGYNNGEIGSAAKIVSLFGPRWYLVVVGDEYILCNPRRYPKGHEQAGWFTGELGFFFVYQTDIIDPAKKLYAQPAIQEILRSDFLAGEVFPVVTCYAGVWYVCVQRNWRPADPTAPLCEAARNSWDNPDQPTNQSRCELGFGLSNSARIKGYISDGVIIVDNIGCNPADDQNWLTVVEYLRSSHDYMTMAALARAAVCGQIHI